METIEGALKVMMWVVTGASGQLGLALAKQLTLEGIDFIALDSKQLDITNVDQVNEVISRINPQIIVNTAAWTDVDGAENKSKLAFAVNEKGVKNLALAAKFTNSTLMHISTDYVFSGESDQPFHELAQLDPQSVYGCSKAAGELVIKEVYSGGSYVVRTAWLYSEYGKNFAKTMCSLALNSDHEVPVVDDQVGQPTNAQDLASQMVLLANSGADFGIYHGTNSGQSSWFEFAREIFRLSGADVNRVIGVSSSQYPTLAKRPKYSVLGHKSWSRQGLAPMQAWKTSLERALPGILNSVGCEES